MEQVARQYFAGGHQKSGGSAENGPEDVLADPCNHTTQSKEAPRIASHQRVAFLRSRSASCCLATPSSIRKLKSSWEEA